MIDVLSDWLDILAWCLGLLLIVWIGAHSSRRKRASGWPPAAMMGVFAWLAAMGFALYLVFG